MRQGRTMARARAVLDRLPGRRWWLKTAVATAAVVAITGHLATRFGIRIDPQVERCIPGARAFLVDRHDRDVGSGDLVAFEPPDLGSLSEADAAFVKRVAALPGERVVVGAQETRVGERVVARGLAAAATIGVEPARFVRTETVPADSLWVVAPGRKSVDSRYWGALDEDRVIGTAYVLF